MMHPIKRVDDFINLATDAAPSPLPLLLSAAKPLSLHAVLPMFDVRQWK
jgi:hypothetical protein